MLPGFALQSDVGGPVLTFESLFIKLKKTDGRKTFLPSADTLSLDESQERSWRIMRNRAISSYCVPGRP